MTKNKVTKDKDFEDRYVYRGVRFERDDRNRGYYGHYRTVTRFLNSRGERFTISTSTRKDLLLAIDIELDKLN